MANTKKYVITSLTLGVIAAASAGLIGLANLITKKQIEKNEKERINKGIAAIFGKNATILDDFDIKEYKYTNHAYEIENKDVETDCWAFRTTGSNMYGKISMIVGFMQDEAQEYSFAGLYLVLDEQTYASTLEDEYIKPLNNGDVYLDDVSCGATYGAKLVRDMVYEAKDVANTLIKERGTNNG